MAGVGERGREELMLMSGAGMRRRNVHNMQAALHQGGTLQQ